MLTDKFSLAPSVSVTVSVIIPALNEAQNLPFVLRRIPAWVGEVILVDGHSTDDTVRVAREVWPDIRIVTQDDCCKGAALRQGFAAATGDIIVMLDADGSTDPSEMGMFIRLLRNGAHFVKGSRFLQGAGTADISPLRQWGNLGLTLLVRILFGCSFSDLCYGYIAFWRDLLPVLDLDADGFEIETLMNLRALRARLKVVEVHSFEARRLSGQSHLNTFRDGWRVLLTILRERFAPARRNLAGLDDGEVWTFPQPIQAPTRNAVLGGMRSDAGMTR
ncbi:MAG: glycosyltransferase family 2 protein [Chloroflexi bacterium]|nr:glycosyltransferase family 2 protein [Chloroflexota bacterium]